MANKTNRLSHTKWMCKYLHLSIDEKIYIVNTEKVREKF